MSGKIQTRLALFAALAALVAVLIPTTLAFGSDEDGVVDAANPSYVFLQLGNTDQVIFETETQAITSGNNCRAVSFAASPDLLVVSPIGGDLGFVKDGFGVRSSGDGNGEPCGRVEADDGEAIEVSLGSNLSGYLMSAVDVDLEAKFGAIVKVDYIRNGVSMVTDDFDPSDTSDDGPDSADGDNYRYFQRPMLNGEPFFFDTVRFTPTAGAISLEGGADGTENSEKLVTTNNFSQFEVVQSFDGDITCGQTETIDEGMNTFGDITMHSEDKGDGMWLVDLCDLKPFNADTTDDSLAFVPELEGTSARYTIKVTAEEQPITVDGNGQITSLVAVYNPEGDLGFPVATTDPLQACLTTPVLDITDQPAYDDFWTNPNGTGLLPAGESACWFEASVTPTGENVGTEFWGIYFEDDPGFSFR